MFPRRCVAERAILGYFAKSNRTTDLLGAILSIPRNLRLLYVHSYQSLVWNEMASERIRIYGNTLQLGDLVDISAYTDNESLKTESESKNSRQEHIIIITKDEELKKYSIDDLVLPLPGYDVLYPQNKMMEAYKTFMEVHGFDPHDMKRKQKDFSLPGSYRKVLVRPKDYEFKLVRYDDPDQEINITEEPNLRDGKYLALILQFTLPTSSYATMCLREVLKSDTSSVYHQELSRATKLDANTDPVSDSAIVDDSLSDNNETVDAQR
jgi:tRNA pseudouridine13 synthase